jgi:hypothetical protein
MKCGDSAAAQRAFDKVTRLMETRAGIAVSASGWFEELGTYIVPLMDVEPAPTQAAGTDSWIRLDLRLRDEKSTGEHPPAWRGVVLELWSGSTRQVVKTGNDSPEIVLGASPKPKWLRILWPDGTRQCEAIASDTLTKWKGRPPLQFLDSNSTVVVRQADRRPW